MDEQKPTTVGPDSTPPESTTPKSSPAPSEPLPSHPAFSSAVKARSTVKSFWVVLVVVLLIAGVYGTYSWQHQQVTNLQSQKLAADTTNNKLRDQIVELQASTSTAKDVLAIPELGVQATFSAALSDATYAVVNQTAVNGQANVSVGLTTLALIKLDPKCNAAQAPLGWLSKTTGKYPTAATTENSSGKLVKQYSTYYIAYKAPQAACSSIKAAQTATTTDIAALPTWSTAIQTLQ